MRRLLYFTLLLLTMLVCVVLLYGAYTVARQEAINNLLEQETILARQAAQGILGVFEHAMNISEALAKDPHVIELSPIGRRHLDAELLKNPHEVLTLSRLDSKGTLLYSTPDNSVAGRNIADQDHVRSILENHRTTVSDVFTSVQGFRAVALHVPVFKGKEFTGTVALLLDFDAIAKRFMEGVRVAETGYAFVYSQQGMLLYSPVPGLAGRHYQDVAADFPELKAAIERMLRGETGHAQFSFNRVREQTTEATVKHAVFMPIKLENTFWSICVATPESEILAVLKRFSLYLLPLGSVVLLLVAVGVAFGLRHFVLEKEVVRRRETETALRESEERYRSVLENISDVFYRTDLAGRLIMVSPSGLALSGFSSMEELLGKPSDFFWRNPKDREIMLAAIREHGSVRDYEVELVDKNGRLIHAATSSGFYRNKDGHILGVEGIFRDITQRKHDSAALAESARRFHSLFDHMTEGVALHTLVRDENGEPVNYRIEDVNRSFERIFGVRAEDVSGRLVTEAFGLVKPPHLLAWAEVAATGQPCSFEDYLPALGKHLAVSGGPWVDGGFAVIVTDISERKQMEEQMLHRALHDPLTGLANRTLCLDRISLAAERTRRKPGSTFAVVFIDLDRFKVINDSLGHEAGDRLLREVAARLLLCTRRVDTVCRYGGDEFTLVLEELSSREVLRTIRRIRASLKSPVSIGSHNIQVEASFGVAYPPQESIGPEDLLRNANIALHQAKQHGRNRVVVYKPSMHQAAIQAMSLESDIRQGLDNGEFYLLYQPIFDLNANRLSGFEALLRWQHPLRGLVSPAEFIPVAEECGSIFALGSLALDQGCQDMADLLRAMPGAEGLTLSVNLSPRQFARQGLAEQIDRALTLADLPPKALVLEITESSIMKHPEAAANILARIKARGVGIAIDDFGTGYSSLSALQRLPLDRLKIDRSFVSRITDSAEDREIVRAIITLARSLLLKTVAEGIETEEQRVVLRDLGCDFGQGYLCSRPVTLAQVPQMVNAAVCQPPS